MSGAVPGHLLTATLSDRGELLMLGCVESGEVCGELSPNTQLTLPLAHTPHLHGRELYPLRKPHSPASQVSYPPSGTSNSPGNNAESFLLLCLVAGIPSPSDPLTQQNPPNLQAPA